MKKILKLLLVFSIFIFNLNTTNVVSNAASVSGNYEYELINNNKEVRILKYIGNEEYVYLPNTIAGKPVIELGGESFTDNDKIKEVEFNTKLQTIREGAFYDCDNLRKVVIPNNVKNVYSDPYDYHGETFGYCDNLKTVIIGSGLKSINPSTFINCLSLESVTIGNGVEEIKDNAFNECKKLSKIKFGTGLKYINDYVFYNCDSLTSVTLPSNTKYIGVRAFDDCDNLKNINLNNKLETISNGAFYSCDSLEKIVIPNSVTNIYSDSYDYHGQTFGYCGNLKTVVIGSGLKSINSSTFINCSLLESVTIGNGVEEIKDDAFNACKKLSKIKFGTGLKYINDYVFYDCDSLTSMTLPSNTRYIGVRAFDDCDNLKNINLNNKLETISNGAFYSCDSLEKIVIPNSVTNIYSDSYDYHGQTFGYCGNLKTVVIGSGLKSINSSTFINCLSLESVTIGNGVEEIKDNAFNECKKLSEIKFGTGLKYINDYVFYNCDSLTSMTLPSNTRYIGVRAFDDCDNLKNISLNGKLETISSGAFYSCDSLEKIVIPNSVTNVYSDSYDYHGQTFGYCGNLKTVVIGSGLKSINSSTFTNCSSLENVTIGKNVKEINNDAFYENINLTKVYFLGNAPSISESSFKNTNSNLKLYYKSGATGFNNIGYKTATFNQSDTHKTVTFKPNGGSGSDQKVSTLNGLTVAQPSNPVRTGYSFEGWYKNSQCTGEKWDFNKDIVNSDTTLYAKWSLNKYKLTFNATGGKTPTSSKTVSYNTKLGTLPVPTKANYIFAGWYPAQDGSGTKFTSSTKMLARNMTLYAKWINFTPPTAKASSASHNSNKVTWNVISNANGYEVYVSTSKNGKYTLKKNITSNKTTNYTNTGLTTGKTYYYKVRAYKTVNGEKQYGDFSQIVSSKPVLNKPAVTLTSSSKKVNIKWAKIAGATGYEIERSTKQSTSYTKIKTVTSGSTTSYANTKLTKNKAYYYRVRAYKTVNGKKVYSSYSSPKYIKVK